MGLVYRSARMYRLAMRILERGADAQRRRTVADAIEPGSSVVDLCCGDAALGPLLVAKGCAYTGLDINPVFVRWGEKHGIDVRHWDANSMEIPPADVICMLSSLYQFIPDDSALIERMLRQAREQVIISEPVHNWASSGRAPLRWASRFLTSVEGRTFEARHTEASLHALVDQLPAEARTVRLRRELIVFLRAPRVSGARRN